MEMVHDHIGTCDCGGTLNAKVLSVGEWYYSNYTTCSHGKSGVDYIYKRRIITDNLSISFFENIILLITNSPHKFIVQKRTYIDRLSFISVYLIDSILIYFFIFFLTPSIKYSR